MASGGAENGSVCWRVLVSGLVQGVGFRWFTVEQARALGVRGWVRNLTDGRVEVWVEGAPAAVEAMLAWLASGPSQARVQGLERHAEMPAGHEGFSVRRSSLL